MPQIKSKSNNTKGSNQGKPHGVNLNANELNKQLLKKSDFYSKPCQPHPHDVLYGRGNGVAKHMGNVNFHKLVCTGKLMYKSASCRADRRKIATDIIKEIKSLSPPGRFLIPDSSSQTAWYVASEHRAMMKTCQALRENIQATRDTLSYTRAGHTRVVDVTTVDNKLSIDHERFISNLSEERKPDSTTKMSTQHCISPSVSNKHNLSALEDNHLIISEEPTHRQAANGSEEKQATMDGIKKTSLNIPGGFFTPDAPSQAPWYLAIEHRAMMKIYQELRENVEAARDAFATDVAIVNNKLCMTSSLDRNTHEQHHSISTSHSHPFAKSNELMITTQAKNIHQRVPKKHIDNANVTSKKTSEYPSLSSCSEPSMSFNQKQNMKPIEMQVDVMIEAAKNKNAQQMQSFQTGHYCTSNKPGNNEDAHLKVEAEKHANRRLLSGKLQGRSQLDDNCMDVKSDEEQACTVTFDSSSVLTCDIEQEAKLEEKHSEDQITENMRRGGYRRSIMTLSYIGQSFANHKLKGNSSMTNESRIAFEELMELKHKGEDAVLHLPSIVGSLCQRIIDLEEQLSP